MHIKSEAELIKHHAGHGISGAVLLYSPESFLVQAWREKILGRFGGGGEEGFNLQRLDGRKPDIPALDDATQMLPLFAQEKCVLLDDLEAGKLTAADTAQLTGIFENLPPECTLIITARPPHFDPKSSVGRKLIAAAAKHGCAAELPARDAAAMVKFIQQTAKKHDCSAAPAVCREILRVCGKDMHYLASETAKLCAFAGGGEITDAHLGILTVKTEARVFDLTRMILAGYSQKSLETLRDLFYLREAPVAILSVLIMAYVDFYRARAARDAGATAADVAAKFGYKGKEFRVNQAFGTRISAQALRQSIGILADCDRRLKSTPTDDRILLERAVVNLIGVRNA
ncbi:MAG: DNA polymerase III subunit delta [Oscillospiraceae bacterium]|nr:DNA polymerase III subunit delta [Oscillospiraceae bacterium]